MRNPQAASRRLPAGDATEAGGAEGLWLTYTRLLAWPSIICCAVAVLLHQLACQLGMEPTHWGVASFIGGLCFVLIMGLWAAARRRPIAIMVAATALLFAAIGLSTWEHCEANQIALFGLVGISVALIAPCVHDLRMQKQSEFRNTNARQLSVRTDFDDFSQHEQVQLVSSAESGAENLGGDGAAPVARRPIWARYAIAIVLSGLAFIYLVVVPTAAMVYHLIRPSTAVSRTLTDMSIAEAIQLHTISVLVMLFFLAAGASIGSFLNVLIFRWPRRRPLFLPSSACPNCDTEIAGTDNIPVLSWLRLGGRCRTCGIAISARYPIIEAIVGLVFVVFYFCELLSGGANLPIRSVNTYNGIVWILLYTKWDLVSLYFFHMFTLVCLLAWGMINLDRFRVPIRGAVGAIILTLVLVGVFPHLNPTATAWKFPIGSAPDSVVSSVWGCFLGLAGSMVLWPLSRRREVNPSLDQEAVGDSRVPVSTAAVPSHELALGSVVGHQGCIDGRATLPVEFSDREFSTVAESSSGQGHLASGDLANSGRGVCNDAASGGRRDDRELYGGTSSEPNDQPNIACSLALVGAALGGGAACIVIVFTAIALMASQYLPLGRLRLSVRSWPVTLWVFTSTALLILFWQEAHQLFVKPILGMVGGL